MHKHVTIYSDNARTVGLPMVPNGGEMLSVRLRLVGAHMFRDVKPSSQRTRLTEHWVTASVACRFFYQGIPQISRMVMVLHPGRKTWIHVRSPGVTRTGRVQSRWLRSGRHRQGQPRNVPRSALAASGSATPINPIVCLESVPSAHPIVPHQQCRKHEQPSHVGV